MEWHGFKMLLEYMSDISYQIKPYSEICFAQYFELNVNYFEAVNLHYGIECYFVVTQWWDYCANTVSVC